MNLSSMIGFPKDEVLKVVDESKINYKIVTFDENTLFDTELFVKFEYINNMLILYFDRFKLNV